MKKDSKILKSVLGIIISIVIVTLGIQSEDIAKIMNGTENTQENNTTISKTVANDEFLKIYYIDVGQADSILVINKDKTMLIDAGNNDDGDLVVNFIKDKGVSKLDYVIGTHPHEDHIGGLDNVIKELDIGKLYMPKIQTNTKTFEDVLDAALEKGVDIEAPNVGDKFNVSDANCEVMSSKIDNKNLNLSSIVIRMEYGNQSYLFMGDAETENENERTWTKTDVLNVGHHGSNTSSSRKFLEQVSPEIAVISVGKDNKYGHPKQVIIDRLNKMGIKIYRTDLNGTILIKSDGNENKIETEK